MATAAILKNRKIATYLLQFGRFRQNLASWCSSILLSVPAVKILKILKIQDGSRHRLEKSKNRHISAVVWPISSKFDTVTHVDPLDRGDRQSYEIVKNPGTRITHDLRTDLRHILWPIQRTLGSSEVYWPAWEMHCNNLRLVLGLGLVRVSSRVRVRIRVKVRVSVLVTVTVSIKTSWVVNFALFRCYQPVIYTRPQCFRHHCSISWFHHMKYYGATLRLIGSITGQQQHE